jgi:hypothetical protein
LNGDCRLGCLIKEAIMLTLHSFEEQITKLAIILILQNCLRRMVQFIQ